MVDNEALYKYRVFSEPTKSWIMDARSGNQPQLSPYHKEIKPERLADLCNMSSINDFGTKVTSRKNISETLLPDEAEKNKISEEEYAKMTEYVMTADELMEHKNDVDYLITTGVNIKCLKNPLHCKQMQWSRNIIELWLCRIPLKEQDDLGLVKINKFRRYGPRREFELECTFQLPGQKGKPNSLSKQRTFWIHICLLSHTPTYRKMIAQKYHWDWRKIEYNFNEMLDGYGSDNEEILCTPRGDVYAVKTAKRTQIPLPSDGNYYKIYNINEVSKSKVVVEVED